MLLKQQQSCSKQVSHPNDKQLESNQLVDSDTCCAEDLEETGTVLDGCSVAMVDCMRH